MHECRLCLRSSTQCRSIFADDSDISMKIHTCLPIIISQDDELPKNICYPCYVKIEYFYQFRNRVVDLQSRFSLLQTLHAEKEVKELQISEKWDDELFDSKGAYISVHTQTDEDCSLVKYEDIKQEQMEYLSEADQFEEVDTLLLIKEELPIEIKVESETEIPLKQSKTRKTTGRSVKSGHLSSPEVGNDNHVKDSRKLSIHRWTCCICFHTSRSKLDLIQHYKTHQLLLSKISGTESIQYKCSLCEKSYKKLDDISLHGIEEHKLKPMKKILEREKRTFDVKDLKFICDLCDEKFVFMRELLQHRRSSHADEADRKFVLRCMHCRQEFNRLNSLRRHVNTHNAEQRFLCTVCGKVLSTKQHLNIHMRIHTGFKPHVCRTCGKGFVKGCNLKFHERVHTGERPHICKHCGKGFSQSSSLTIHERCHSGLRPYVCTLCNKGFTAKGALSMHLKTTCIN